MVSSEQKLVGIADSWIDKEELPVSPALKVQKKNDPWYGYTEEEIEDSKEFIRCYMRKDFEALLQIPVKPVKRGFWFESHEDYLESAFNTYDFQKTWGQLK